jgi:hypothetical protein
MEQADYQYSQEKLARLKIDYQVEVPADWGEDGGTWEAWNLDQSRVGPIAQGN